MAATDMMYVVVPPQIKGLPLVVSFSAGKDSTATGLALKEAGLAFHAVTADTVAGKGRCEGVTAYVLGETEAAARARLLRDDSAPFFDIKCAVPFLGVMP